MKNRLLQNKFIAGLPATGRTSYIIDLILQDVNNGLPVIVFDGYADLSEKIISNIPSTLLPSVAYIDVGNKEHPIGLNIFEFRSEDDKHEICNFVIGLMYDLYDPKRTGIIGPRFEHAVRNAILTITAKENVSFIELVRCLTDADFVNELLMKVKDPMVLNYWKKQVAQTSDFHKSEVLDYIISKFGRFVTDARIRNIIGQTTSTIQFEKLISENKVILFDFGNLYFDKEAFQILSSFLMEKLIHYLKSRGGPKDSVLSLYIDEISLWPPSAIMDMLQDARRLATQITCSTQRISRIEEVLRNELFCCPTLVCFRVGTDDATVYAPEFHSNITIEDLCLLPKFHAYIKQLDDDNPSPVQLINLTKKKNPWVEENQEQITKVKSQSHQRFSHPLAQVEEEINQRQYK